MTFLTKVNGMFVFENAQPIEAVGLLDFGVKFNFDINHVVLMPEFSSKRAESYVLSVS